MRPLTRTQTGGLEIRRDERSLFWSRGMEVARMMSDSKRRKQRADRWRVNREAMVTRQPTESSETD